MTEHRSEHEVLLAELLGGERDAADPEVAARLAACPGCRERWSALQNVRAKLEGAEAARREHLGEVERGAPAPGEERIKVTLERLARQEPHVRRRRGWLLAAAAAVLIVGVYVAGLVLDRPDEPGPSWLGSGRFHPIAPQGEVERFDRFEWTYDGEAAAYNLLIYAEDDGKRDLLREIPRWKDTRWTPDAEFVRALPQRIYWQVFALDEFGTQVDSMDSSAWLSSR